MNKLNSKSLSSIINNKKSGSSELVDLLNKYFLTAHLSKSEIIKDITLVKSKLGHFQAVYHYLSELKVQLKGRDQIKYFLIKHSKNQDKKYKLIYEKIYPELKKVRSIITLSRSGSLIEVLKLWYQKNKQFKVVICESRPKLEGRSMAEELADLGIKSLLITDAMMGLFVPHADAAIIGADVVLKNGNVINKVGSKSLALFCKEFQKPFFVATTKEKFSNRNKCQTKYENPNEILEKKRINLSAINIYFEEIEKKYITKIFTD